jgi:AhpD family alkylhydroperoxidase
MSTQARMKNPAAVLPGLGQAVGGIYRAMHAGGAPKELLELVHLRASQINGCSYCVQAGATAMRKAGESDERLWAVAAWRESPHFTGAERAALALAEHMTRLADSSGDPVPDRVWDDAADHFDEGQLAAIVTMVATTNFFNRINATVHQPAGGDWSA